MSNKILVAYFSCSGVTAEAAKTIARVAGADLFRITPAVPYTEKDLDWTDKNSRSSVEMRNLDIPEIAETVDGMESYDTVFIGFPVWWYLAPTIINGFLKSFDITGKTVVPFATSGSSGIQKAAAVLAANFPAAEWKEGMRVTETATADDIKAWIASLGI